MTPSQKARRHAAGGGLNTQSVGLTDTTAEFRDAILSELGHAPELIEPGTLQRFSTSGRRGDKSGWCQMFTGGRAGVFGCWRAGSTHIWTTVRRERMSVRERIALDAQVKAAARQRDADRRAGWAAAGPRLLTLWRDEAEFVPADGSGDDLVTLYLRNRLALGPGEALAVPSVIRYHPALPYHHDGERVGTWPAMVATLQAPDGALVALHRTWLTPEGRKAPVLGLVKKLTSAAGPVMGGCIRLAWPGNGATDTLGIAEGIETALAARLASGVPTVAAYSAGALAAWQWPRWLRRLVIFADADAAGADAADNLLVRARAAGLHCQVLAPTDEGTDWADVWAQRCVDAGGAA